MSKKIQKISPPVANSACESIECENVGFTLAFRCKDGTLQVIDFKRDQDVAVFIDELLADNIPYLLGRQSGTVYEDFSNSE